MDPAEIGPLNDRLGTLPTDQVLAWAWARFGARAAIGTSFQGAGLVMMHMAAKAGLGFPVFTIDTGLLFPETLELRHRLEQFLGIQIESLKPALDLDAQARQQGPELWKRDPDLCCTIRKVMPLKDRLRDLDCWITGLRREQSDTRSVTGLLELHADDVVARPLAKLNPMAGWRREAVWDYIRQHGIPYNPLHDRGYRSIGCQPCTSAGAEGGERAGRWTGFQKTECGIHTFMSRKA
jgi:phosphoadenosine phosphosulfate reductase